MQTFSCRKKNTFMIKKQCDGSDSTPLKLTLVRSLNMESFQRWAKTPKKKLKLLQNFSNKKSSPKLIFCTENENKIQMILDRKSETVKIVSIQFLVIKFR